MSVQPSCLVHISTYSTPTKAATEAILVDSQPLYHSNTYELPHPYDQAGGEDLSVTVSSKQGDAYRKGARR